ncbi:MAG: hypothetical protein AAFX76_03945 [Planctomycetota bacterium]
MPSPAKTPLPTNACCHDCDYPLHGLDRHACPECGRPFDPDKPRSYRLVIDAADAELDMTLDMKVLTWLGLCLSPLVFVFVLTLVLGVVRG